MLSNSSAIPAFDLLFYLKCVFFDVTTICSLAPEITAFSLTAIHLFNMMYRHLFSNCLALYSWVICSQLLAMGWRFWSKVATSICMIVSAQCMKDDSGCFSMDSLCLLHANPYLASELLPTWSGEVTEIHCWCSTEPLFAPSWTMAALCMAQRQIPTCDNWTAFTTLGWDWHWELSAPVQFPVCTQRPMKLHWRNVG